MTAKEGSCITISCTRTDSMYEKQLKWFWLKNAVWDQKSNKYTGDTVSSYTQEGVVSVERVKYIGSVDLGGSRRGKPSCSLTISDLKLSDHGTYHFRFIGSTHRWTTKTDIKVEGKLTLQRNRHSYQSINFNHFSPETMLSVCICYTL